MPTGFHSPTSDLESIIGVQFSILSQKEIEDRSAVEVTSQATYEETSRKSVACSILAWAFWKMERCVVPVVKRITGVRVTSVIIG